MRDDGEQARWLRLADGDKRIVDRGVELAFARARRRGRDATSDDVRQAIEEVVKLNHKVREELRQQ